MLSTPRLLPAFVYILYTTAVSPLSKKIENIIWYLVCRIILGTYIRGFIVSAHRLISHHPADPGTSSIVVPRESPTYILNEDTQ